MKISVVTVSYNSVQTIEDTIRSVLSQTWPEIEYIIIDGGSTDGTQDIARKYEDSIAHFISEPDYGIYDAMNKGVRLATGDVIGFLNADDVYTSNKVLEAVGRAFLELDVDSVYGDLCYVSNEDPKKVVRYWKAGRYTARSFRRGWMPPHPTFFVKKSILDKYGAFDPAFRLSGDYELILRLLYKHRISAHYLDFCMVKMRVGGAGNRWIESRLIANLEDRLAWKKNKLHPSPLTTILKPLRKVFQLRASPPRAAF